MNFSVERLPDLPIVVTTLLPGYSLQTDFPKSYIAASQLLNNESEPVYYMIDLANTPLDMEGIMVGANKTSRDSGGTFHHPMVKEVLLVSPSISIKIAVEGLKSELFGNVNAKAFVSRDDALAYVRSQC